MALAKEERTEICKKYERKENDTGSPEVQVALLTARIKSITEHLQSNKKDHASRRGLRMLVGRRSKLLRYLARQDHARYRSLIASLGLRR